MLMRLALSASLIVATATLPSATYAQAGAAPSVAGIWQAENGQMKIEMVDGASGPIGRFLWGRRALEADGKTFKRDSNNPDAHLRGRSLQGITILQNFSWDPQGRRWEGGRLYDGTSGRTMSAQLTLKNGKLEMRVYMGTPMLGRTLRFQRVSG
jgi:uncharacterized protein (DUF2147 family)